MIHIDGACCYLNTRQISGSSGSAFKLSLIETGFPHPYSVGRHFVMVLFFFIVASTTAMAGSAYAPDGLGDCPPGLVHYFGFDEEAGGSYEDYIGNATATCSDCPSPVASMFYGAQRFDGANDGLVINEIDNFNWAMHGSFSMEMWVKTTAKPSNNMVIIGREGADSRLHWWLGMDQNGYTIFNLNDRNRKGFAMGEGGVKINDGQWHHIAVVRDGRLGLNKLYVDGYAIFTFEYRYSDGFEDSSPVTIGYINLDNKFRFAGEIDELMLYNRALDENEMRQRYNNRSGNYCGPKQFAPTITSDPIAFGVTGQTYLYEVQAVGSPVPTFSIVNGPPGLVVNPNTGLMSWNPTAAGTFRVTVRAANGSGQDEQTFGVVVKEGVGEKPGLVHHWMLHEVAGTRYNDFYTPYYATSENEARPLPIQGVVSGGQRFDGKTTGLDVSNSSNFNWRPDDSFTIELWMRSTGSTSGNRVLIGRDGTDSDLHWWIGANDDGLAVFMLKDIGWSGDYIGNTGPRLTDGKWHQVVAVRDGGAGINRLYVDGKKIAERNWVYQNGFASLSAVNIGYLDRADKYRYEGDLDEVKLFGRALSDEEIQERYQTVYDGILELIRFEGRYANGTVMLEWETLTETDLADFVIERSEDGDSFTEIGTVEAAGNSNVNLVYDFPDNDPLKGIAYYRLKIRKTNGDFTYSDTIQIENNSPVATLFYVYPNPVKQPGQVQVEITNLPPDEALSFSVSDLSGRQIIAEEVQAEPNGTMQLQVAIPEGLRPGIYNLTVVTQTKTVSRKLIVL